MDNFKHIYLIYFLTLPLICQLLSQQAAAARSEENIGTTSSPLTVSTQIFFCDKVPQAVNIVLTGRHLTWPPRVVNPGTCHVFTVKDGYSGTLNFLVNGNQSFRENVSGGTNCYDYDGRALRPGNCDSRGRSVR